MTVADATTHAPTAEDFCDLILGAVDGWLTIFAIDATTGARHVRWASTPIELAAAADELAPSCNVWFGCAGRAERLGSRRGGIGDCTNIGALWIDVDIEGPGHKIEGIARDEAHATEVVRRFQLPPTVAVNSGGGLQVWWVLDEPVGGTDATELLARWGATWAAIGAEMGVHIDNVFNLDRIMRLPGTMNRKEGGARPVTIEAWRPERSYSASDIDELLIDPPQPAQAPQAAGLPYIGPERPGDAFSAAPGAAQRVLESAGFHSPTRISGGSEPRIDYVRPGKRSGTSASVWLEDGRVTIWSDSCTTMWPAVEVRKHYDAFGLYARIFHGGDYSGASDALEAQGYGTKAVDLSWIDDVTPPAAAAPQGDEEPPESDEPDDPPAMLNIRWTTELADKMPPEPPVLVTDLIRRGEFTALAAPRAIGKTWFVMDLADKLARGEGAIAGHFRVQRTAQVLYLQGELDEWGSATRWKMLTGIDRPLPAVAESFDRCRFRAVERSAKAPRADGGVEVTKWTDAEIPDALEATITALGVDLVILDPWAVYLAASENSNDDVEAVLGALREITLRTGVAWLIVHHITGKAERSTWTEPEDLWRGATRLADWASTRVTVLPHYTDKQAQGLGWDRHEGRRHVDIHVLRRNGKAVPTINARRSDTGHWERWRPEDDAPSSVEVLLQTLRREGGELPSMRAAVDATGLTNHAVREAVKDAEDLGLVIREEGARGSFAIVLNPEMK